MRFLLDTHALLWYAQGNGALSSRVCDMECFLKNSWNVLRITNKIAIFYKGFHGDSNFFLLENVTS